jgi:hypothetical protein
MNVLTMGTLPQDLSLPTSRNRPYSPTMSTVPTSWRHRDKVTSTHWVWVEHNPTKEAGWYTQQAGTWLRYQPDDSVQTQSQVRRHEGQLVTTTPTTTIPSRGVLGPGLTPRTTTMKVGGHIPVKAGLAIPQDRLGLVAPRMGALLAHPPEQHYHSRWSTCRCTCTPCRGCMLTQPSRCTTWHSSVRLVGHVSTSTRRATRLRGITCPCGWTCQCCRHGTWHMPGQQ